MINKKELRKIAKAKLKDAELLYQHKRYDSAYYLVGYAVELALKAKNLSHLKVGRISSDRKISKF